MAGHKKEKLLVKGPIYPGGQKAMLLFIQNNLRYPPEAIAANVEGTVRIRLSIDHRGKVFKSRVITGLGHGCDEEADRLVRLLQFEVPKMYKLKVQHHRTLNIHFKMQVNLEQMPAAPLPNALSIQYTINNGQGQPTLTTKPSTTTSEGYHYTITIML